MRAYLVQGGNRKRIAGTNALAREAREELMELGSLKKKDVTITDIVIPDDKQGKLDFINKLCEELDPKV